MMFDVIIGNPPYQEAVVTGREGNADAMPIYHKFVEQAVALGPKNLVMITPSRWFAGGKANLESFRKSMISDRRLRSITDFPEATDCFPGVQIRGGVSFFCWDREYEGDCFFTTKVGDRTDGPVLRDLRDGDGVLVRDNEAMSIIARVNDYESLQSWVLTRYPFGGEIYSNYKYSKLDSFDGSIPLIYSNRVGYIKSEQITRNLDLVDRYKVLLPKAGDPGISGSTVVLGEPIALAPGSACTQTYLVAGTFNTAEETENYAHYLCTKFVRFLVLQRKITQDVTPDRFKFVPMLDMTRRWTDEQLYDEFGLTEEERAYIEASIKPREPILSLDSPIPHTHIQGGRKYKARKAGAK